LDDLALFSFIAFIKTRSSNFPVSLFCIDILRNRTFSLKLITEKIPFFIPALLMGLLTINAQKEIGATGEEYFGLASNILFGFYGVMMYFFKLLLPIGQSAFYPFPPLNEKLSVVYYAAPLFTLLLALITYLVWKKHKALVFGISFYIINLLLVLQVFSVGSAIIAERYTYVPYIGIFLYRGISIKHVSKREYEKGLPDSHTCWSYIFCPGVFAGRKLERRGFSLGQCYQ
jgi:hypothetical protein